MPPGTGADGRPGAVIAALQRATHVTLHAVAARLTDFGLTGSEQNVLAALDGGVVSTVGELVTATGTRPSTLTSVLDRLEQKHLLVRDVDYQDRRSVLVSLTPTGQDAAAAVLAVTADIEQSALVAVGKRQLEGFFAVARALAEVAP